MHILRRLLAGLVIAVLLGGLGGMTVGAGYRAALPEVVAATAANEADYREAFVTQDLDALMATFTDEPVFEDRLFGDHLEGAAAVRRMQRDVMRLTDAEATTLQDHFVAADGSRAVSMWQWAGTNYLGRPFDMPVLVLHEYRDGKIAQESLFYAAADAYAQLTTPPAEATTTTPMTTAEPLAGMVTEEVEAGVLRVVNDGVRDIAIEDLGYPSASVDVAPDGSVWLSGPGALSHLGGDTFPAPEIWMPGLEVGPDGALWGIVDASHVQSFDGEAWTTRSEPTGEELRLRALAVGPDGTVWVTARDEHKHCSEAHADCLGTVLLRVEDDGSLTTIEDWADVYDGDVSDDELAVAPDGSVWLAGMARWDGPEAEGLLRFDGREWAYMAVPEGFVNHPLGDSMAFGPDGELWLNAGRWEPGVWPEGGLVRLDDQGWTEFTEADGVHGWGGTGFLATDLLSVAPDGSLWLNATRENLGCDGVAHYDGTTWTTYLPSLCVHDLDVGPDGRAWVRASRYGGMNPVGEIETFVITPEADAEAS